MPASAWSLLIVAGVALLVAIRRRLAREIEAGGPAWRKTELDR